MIVIIGSLIVLVSVFGGYMMAGGNILALLHVSELIIIGGAGLGALVVMSPRKVLVDLYRQILQSFKGTPFSKASYEELLKALYELFLLGRRNGMIALEEHVLNPQTSSIFTKYPGFLRQTHAVEFLCNALRPIIDGKIKPDQLKLLMDVELESMEEEHYAPVNVLTKTADAMPGFGIVAAVLGIVITMAAITGPIDQIGQKVGAALVGTFLGILISYGFLNPLAVKLEFTGLASASYMRCIASAVTGFANGMAPIMAVEMARRGLNSEVKPGADELESMLKALTAPAKG